MAICVFAVLSSVQCAEPRNSAEAGSLEYALSEAGENRKELLKVIDRYSENPADSLRLRAAEFLIRNMPGHSYYKGELLENYLEYYPLLRKVKQAKLKPEVAVDSIVGKYGPFDMSQLEYLEDIGTVDSAYLCDNIEWAFKVWEEQPWGKNVSFTDFCEYILPYRVGDEPLKPWREKLYRIYNPMLNDIRKMPEAADPLFAARALSDSIRRHSEFRFSASLGYGPHIGPDLVDWQAGNCQEMTDILIYIFRAVGIPCGCDYMPLRGDANVAHFWNFTLDKYGDSHVVYNERQPEPVRQFWGGVKAKVYRKNFSLNKDLLTCLGNPPTSSLHPDFRYPLHRDVTRLYSGRNARELFVSCDSLFRKPTNGIVYLCEASWLDWIPIACASVQKDGIVFEDVEGGVVFVLGIYEGGKIMPVSYPFEFDKKTGGIYFFRISHEEGKITLLNKFNQFFERFPQRMLNGVFEGSDYPDFRTKDTLFTIKELPLRMHNVVYLHYIQKFVRLFLHSNSSNNIRCLWV